ncbi:hypothetical protein [Paraburkholderia antibiotica]|uniref:Uncharacterized protein n=1 Tax=Paraburkholderia antibiotica TaxID=2728839 RepID=A0A7X9X6D7_9BURK|nr:hypothetical protein [Paraburkholderia antibiotica]NML32276.1 hypothetical protein [Paraburkholderia antibiotica]
MTSKNQHAAQPSRTRRAPQPSAESRLDEALMESFPASDPIAVDVSSPSRERARKIPTDTRKRH